MIDGNIYRDMVISAANSIENARDDINKLNVFPVPDGDTGINMSLTMQAGKNAVVDFSGTLSECSDRVAAALLRGGRGNSGVILSLFFRGFSKVLKGKTESDKTVFANAFNSGVDSAYRAVRHPTEGTILTVMRLAGEHAKMLAEQSPDMPFDCYFDEIVNCAAEALAKTPELLPVLKQANVVDAGGSGFLVILKGMQAVIDGNGKVEVSNSSAADEEADFSSFDTDDIKFSYCTECIIDKPEENKPSDDAVDGFKSFIMDCGDSGVFIDDDDFIKFHIHTNDPGKVLTECLKYGVLEKVKIENMKQQHTTLSVADKKVKHEIVAKPKKKYGFVSVAAGEGICALFKDLAVDNVVKGGQTMNPSTDDIVNAVNATPSEVVFVLPNNSNIYMAAKQAETIVKEKKVIVLKSVSIPQGISALLVFDETADVDQNRNAMKAAMKNVKSETMTFAARDSVFENETITEGQILGLVEGKVRYIENSKEDCIKKLASEIKDKSYITLIYGEGETEENANKIAAVMHEELDSGTEINVINGGQPVYYYIISAE